MYYRIKGFVGGFFQLGEDYHVYLRDA